MKEYGGIGSMECPLQVLFYDWGSLQMTNNLLKIAACYVEFTTQQTEQIIVNTIQNTAKILQTYYENREWNIREINTLIFLMSTVNFINSYNS
jgi:hypothetical protein